MWPQITSAASSEGSPEARSKYFCETPVDDLHPARVAEARSELLALTAALEGLPPRRRAVFIASRLEGQPHKLIAERLDLTVRIVDRELKAALDHFGTVVDKKSVPRRGPRPRDSSYS